MNSKRPGIIISVFALAAIFAGIGGTAYAATATVPYGFTSGNTISSTQMNSNFSSLAGAVNANRVYFSYDTGCGTLCPSTTAGVQAVINVNSIAVYASGPGIITVNFNGSAECSVNTTYYYVYLYGKIVPTPAETPYGYQEGGTVWRESLSGAPSGYYDRTMNARRTFSVTTAGTYTYYYSMINWAGTTGPACKMYGGNMDAVFIPNP